MIRAVPSPLALVYFIIGHCKAFFVVLPCILYYVQMVIRMETVFNWVCRLPLVRIWNASISTWKSVPVMSQKVAEVAGNEEAGYFVEIVSYMILILFVPYLFYQTFYWATYFSSACCRRMVTGYNWFAGIPVAIREAAIAGSLITSKVPKYQFSVWHGGFNKVIAGHGVRIGKHLVIPTHVLHTVSSGSFEIRGTQKTLTYQVSQFKNLCTDISVYRPSDSDLIMLGLSKPTISTAQKGSISIAVAGSSSVGTYWRGDLPYLYYTDASTLNGWSGAAYTSFEQLVAVHNGNFGPDKNGGTSADFIKCLLESEGLEASDDRAQQYPQDDEEITVGSRRLKCTKAGWKQIIADLEDYDKNRHFEEWTRDWLERETEEVYSRMSKEFRSRFGEEPKTSMRDNVKNRLRARAATEYRMAGFEAVETSDKPVRVYGKPRSLSVEPSAPPPSESSEAGEIRELKTVLEEHSRSLAKLSELIGKILDLMKVSESAMVFDDEAPEPLNLNRPPRVMRVGPKNSGLRDLDVAYIVSQTDQIKTPKLNKNSRQKKLLKQRNSDLLREIADLKKNLSQSTSPGLSPAPVQ